MSSEGPYRNQSINKFLEIPIIQNENTKFEILCRQLAQYCESVEDLKADLRSAANMQQIVTKLPLKIAVRRSTRKLELRPKEFDITNLDEWLETKNQDQELAFGFGSTKANPDQKKTKSNSKKSDWFQETKKNARNETHTNSGTKVECFVCKEIKCELTMVLGGETGFVLSVP